MDLIGAATSSGLGTSRGIAPDERSIIRQYQCIVLVYCTSTTSVVLLANIVHFFIIGCSINGGNSCVMMY